MKKRRLRILWQSNAPWAKSGYSNQTNELLQRFIKDGWPVACSCFYGLGGGIIDYNGIKCYPVLNDPYGSDAALHHSTDFKADVVIPFQDCWTMKPEFLQKLPRYMPYVPIDSDPCPPPVLDKMRYAYRIITYSEFGRQKLAERGYYSDMIPHGVDMQMFKKKDRAECRKKFGMDMNDFIIGMIAMNKDNPSRKGFQEALEAFKRFKANHNNAKLFIHSLMDFPTGFPIAQYANFLEVDKDVKYLPPYDVVLKLDHSDIADLINCFDILILPSATEGFGMPITEAQACEVPVIVTDFTSMTELVIPNRTGLLTKVRYKRYALQLAYVGHADVDELYDNMEKIVRMDLRKMGEEGRKYMLENYDIDKLVETKWIPLLEEVERDVYGSEVMTNGSK